MATYKLKISTKGSRFSRSTAISNYRPYRLSAVKVKATEGESSQDATDEPLFSKKDLGVVYSQPNGDSREHVQFPMTVPLLPFDVEEVFLPGSVKSLHLYEARYLSLLEDVLSSSSSNKFIGHVIVEQLGDPVGSKASAFPYAYVGENFVMLMGTLCRVLEVKRSQVGALVRIQAECRMAVQQISKVSPYIRGSVVPILDEPVQDRQLVGQQLEQLKSTMQDLQNLTMKFRSKQTQALQHSMLWWEKDVLIAAAAAETTAAKNDSSTAEAHSEDPGASFGSSSSSSNSSSSNSSSSNSGADSSSCHKNAELAERAARLSFAALQRVPEASDMEQLKLLRCCVNALETSDTSKRLKMVQEHMQESQKLLAAKCALKSLKLS